MRLIGVWRYRAGGMHLAFMIGVEVVTVAFTMGGGWCGPWDLFQQYFERVST